MRVFKKILGYFCAVMAGIMAWSILTKPSLAGSFAAMAVVFAIPAVYLISTSRKKNS